MLKNQYIGLLLKDQLLEGIITKKFYDRITKDEYNNKEYSFGEVIDNMGDVEFKIEDINFDDDPEIIIAYKNTDRFYDRALEYFINPQPLPLQIY